MLLCEVHKRFFDFGLILSWSTFGQHTVNKIKQRLSYAIRSAFAISPHVSISLGSNAFTSYVSFKDCFTYRDTLGGVIVGFLQ